MTALNATRTRSDNCLRPAAGITFFKFSVRISTSQTRNVYQGLTIRVRTPFGRYIQEKSNCIVGGITLGWMPIR